MVGVILERIDMSTLIKGRITELKVIEYFLNLGYVVSTPEIPYSYDLLLDIGTRILKIQVKTSRLILDGDVLEFQVSSVTHNSNGYTIRQYNSDKVDYFCTYWEDKCYLIPIQECGCKAKRLRLKPTNNNQVAGVTFADDYLAEKILKSLI